MTLVKAQLVPLVAGATPIPVLFNPTQYSLDKVNVLTEAPITGSSAPIVSYTRGNARTLSMELFCDTYAARSDVREFTNAIYGLLEIDSNLHRPPCCDFVWGGFTFRCYVERVSGRFTLFLENGTPVRASLTVSMKEYVAPADEAQRTNRQSADHTKTRTVRRGETLASIAAEEYGDARLWRPIARANGIENPRTLEAARVLVVPPLPDRAKAPAR